MKKVDSITELTMIIENKANHLENIPIDYLSEKGVAALSAYRAILWNLNFYDTLQEVQSDRVLLNLLDNNNNTNKGQHQEYYKIIRTVCRVIQESVE